MKLDEWKNNELNRLLMEKFNIKAEKKDHPGQSCDEAHGGKSHDEYLLTLEEELEGDQDEIDVAEPKGKITAADFEKLRKDS